MKLKATPVMLVHYLLYVLIVLLLAGVGAGGFLLHRSLASYVTTVDHLKIDSEVNDQALINSQHLKKVLAQNQDNINRAAAIVADTKYYQYQDQIVQDITSYATAANLTVLGFNFASPTASTPTKQTVPGVKTTTAVVSLASPIPYTSYLKFLKLVERNLTKMQVVQLDITGDAKIPGDVNSQSVTIEVYTR